MSTPYRIVWKGVTAIAGGSDGYPRDVIQEEILKDIETVRTQPKVYIADIALEGEDYYGRRLDNYGNCPADYEYEVDLVANTVTIIAYKGRATLDLAIFDGELDEDFWEDLTYGLEEA